MNFVQSLDDDDIHKDFTQASLDEIQRNRLRLEMRKNATNEKNSEAKTTILQAVSDDPFGEEEELLLHPDPSLEDGQELAHGQFQKKFTNRIVEDLDPFYKQNGIDTFCVVTRRFGKHCVYRFSATKSLFLFSAFNQLRYWMIRSVIHPAFDAFILSVILVNCVFLALDNEIANAEFVFTAFYTIELIIKIIARGFVLHRFAYLRDPWNWLDFGVVILAYATLAGSANVSGLRALRVLRAFKSVSIIPGLRIIINALFHSLKPLGEVLLIMLFLVVVVSLIALQAYQGILRRRCVRYPGAGDNITSDTAWQNFVTNESNWNNVDGELVVCGNETGSGFCPTNFVCLGDVANNPNFGITNFDHMGFSLLTSFQLVTLDFWENVYNMIIRASGPWNILFFLVSVFLGPFYLLNLLLAVITLAYSKEVDKQKVLKMNRKEAQAKALSKRQERKKLKQAQVVKNSVSVNPFNTTSNQISPEIIVIPNPSLVTVTGPNQDPMPNAVVAMKRNMFKSNHQNVSVESDDSMASRTPKWKEKLESFKKWFLETFCCWKCSLCFDDLQTVLLDVVEHKAFEIFIMFCIIANTVFLAIDHHGISTELETALNIGNQVFTVIFTVEAALKITAYGPVGYAKNLWNDFDFIIVVISLVELFLEVSGSQGANPDTGLSVLRTLRLLRVFRLARMWGTMQKLVEIIWKTLGAVAYLTIVLFLILFIFAVIGKQLYSQSYANSGPKFDDNLVPRWNFVDFYHSFLLVWRVMCGEWIEPLQECLHITDGDGICIVLFLLVFFISNFLVLNLFTAILLAAFNVDNIKGKREKQDKVRKQRLLALKVIAAFRDNVRKKKSSSNVVQPAPGQNQVASETERDPQPNKTNRSNFASLLRSGKSPRTDIYGLTKLLQAQKQASIVDNLNEGDKQPESLETDNDDNSPTEPEQKPKDIRRQFWGKRMEPNVIITNPSVETFEPDSMNLRRKTNGHLHFSQASLRSSHYGAFGYCTKFYCCCYVQPKEDSTSDSISSSHSRSSISRCSQSENIVENIGVAENESMNDVSRRTSVSTTTITQTEEDSQRQEEDSIIPPNCFPTRLLDRYPLLQTTPKSPVYKYWMKLRLACFKLVNHQFFEWFILFLILASTVSLAMEDAFLDSDPIRKHVLQRLEYVFTALFTLEMLLKLIGIGPTQYFTSVWCLLDCGIVAISWAGIILQATNQATQTGAFRSLRTLRALRPLRAVSRWEGMRVVVNSLIYCIPNIGNVLCVCLLIWFVFGIMGVQFFKGKFFRCVDVDGETLNLPTIRTRNDCIANNYSWINPNINFDNVIIGMVALFQVATFEGWIEVMSDASDVVDVDQQPIRENSQYNIIFFVIFVLIGSFFILNLIVGVIIESFQNLRNQSDSTAIETMMTESQKKFYQTVRTMLNNKPKKVIPPPKHQFPLFIYKIVIHSRFELAIFILICLNMITLGMEHYQMTQAWIDALRVVDILFTSLFAFEALNKIIGLRQYYFKDAFNVFDFLVVLVSISGFILESLISLSVSPTLLRIVRVFRVFRVLRVIRAARGIRRLILTLLVSVPALFNIAVLLSVFLVIFAILGMNSFMNVKLTGALNDQVNFKTFGSSVLLLFRLLTSAGWNDVLDPLMNTRDCTPSNGVNPGDCGDPILAVIYFILFIFLVFLVIVNMYIAIILENFEDILQQDESGITPGDFEEFYSVWALFDPQATQFVTLKKLSNLLDSLRPPFQIQKPNEFKISALELPLFSGERVHCLDVLFALVKRILGDVEISPEIKQQAENLLSKYFPNRKDLEANTTTLILRNQIRAARLIQNAWKAKIERRKNPNQVNTFNDLMARIKSTQAESLKKSLSDDPESNHEQANQEQAHQEQARASSVEELKVKPSSNGGKDDVSSKNDVHNDAQELTNSAKNAESVAEKTLSPRPKTVPASTSGPPSPLLVRPHSVAEAASDTATQKQVDANLTPNTSASTTTEHNTIHATQLQNFVTDNNSSKTPPAETKTESVL